MLLAVVLTGAELHAQSFAETALLFSRTRPGGSARIQGLGGAQVSLGGDFSTAATNPAGLGMYNRSEFSFSPAQTNTTVTGDYFGGNQLLSADNRDTRPGINLSGLGLVFSSDEGARKGFLRGTFAITLTRLNDFNRNIRYQGRNGSSSLIDFFLEDAAGGSPSQFAEGGALFNTVTELAYNNYLIGEATILDPGNNPRDYFSDLSADAVANQEETFETRGTQNQWSFSYGANFSDRFFVGAGLGVRSLRYRSNKTFSENYNGEVINSFTLNEELEIRGSGVNLTVGGIARPIDFIQLGVSLTTPTYYSLTDNFSANMRSSWDDYDYLGDGSNILGNESASTDIVTSEYDLTTPWRLNAGATIFIQKHGFITADIEQVNYTQARYTSEVAGIEFGSDNDQIKGLYRPVTNVRLGAEFRLQMWRFRGGYQFMPEPFSQEQNGVARSLRGISGGIGYRAEKYFVDFALVHQAGDNSYRPYSINRTASPLLLFRQTSTYGLFTVGFTF